MRTNLVIRIPEPCHESWEQMKPQNNGRYCDSCEKVVIDFTGKTDQEIQNILLENTGKKTCGRFTKTQVDRPLIIQLDPGIIRFSKSPRRVFAAALLLVFGTGLFSCYDHQDKKIPIQQVQFSHSGSYTLGTPLVQNVVTVSSDSIPAEIKFSLSGTTITGEIDLPMGNECGNENPQDTLMESLAPPDTMAIEESPTELYMLGGLSYEVTEHVTETEYDSSQSILPFLENSLKADANELLVYPNPSSGEFYIKYTVKERCDVIVELFDQQGRKLKDLVDVKSQHTGEYHIPADLSSFGQDLYLLRLHLGEKLITSRVIVQR